MIRASRICAEVLLAVLALCGVACGLFWGTSALGIFKAYIVATGSMHPAVSAGDLVIARAVPVSALRIGDIVTVTNPGDGEAVTHRITAISAPAAVNGGGVAPAVSAIDQHAPATATLTLKGDANQLKDPYSYEVGGKVWREALVLPHAGYLMAAAVRPQVMAPLLFAVLALLAVTLMPAPARLPEAAHRREPGRRREGSDEPLTP